MTPDELKAYLLHTMRMSHVYQPVMIKRMLLNGGAAEAEEIAKDLLQNDQSQVEYYTMRVNQMVGMVLRNNGIVTKEKNRYALKSATPFTEEEIRDLVSICDGRINAYMQKRGMEIWDHRRRNRQPIDGSTRYQVLNRAHNVCELCGISSEVRALEVDHIIPKNHGGPDALENYQALCYQCNANKRDTDRTDFRKRSSIFEQREEACVFCSPDRKPIAENTLAIGLEDKFPVTDGHSLFIPKRHFSSYFEVTQPEINAIHQLIAQRREDLLAKDRSISGFNIGINQGTDAGQTVMHLHVHLIPRRKGDMNDPRGGVRHVIPERGKY